MLRLVPETVAPPLPDAPDALRFIVLGADALVDAQGQPREGYRLDLENELLAIRRELNNSDQALLAFRAPPTQQGLFDALQRGPAILHISAHGNVVETEDGPTAILHLEDNNGGPDTLLGTDLGDIPPYGVLRLVVLSACKSAAGTGDTVLARVLVQNDIPAAVGMQGAFPDRQSSTFAQSLYRTLLKGHALGEALRQTRLNLNQSQQPYSAGLPVAYVGREGWHALSLRAGSGRVHDLTLPGDLRLGEGLHAPRPLRGRNRELHALAKLYMPKPQGASARVVTIVGTGGMGKTALATSFAERFGWRWPDGVVGLSFATGEVDADRFRDQLARRLRLPDADILREAPAEEQTHPPAGPPAHLGWPAAYRQLRKRATSSGSYHNRQ